jgi:hypothetical protein
VVKHKLYLSSPHILLRICNFHVFEAPVIGGGGGGGGQ